MPHWCNGEHKRVKFAGWRFDSVVWHPLLLLRASPLSQVETMERHYNRHACTIQYPIARQASTFTAVRQYP